VSWLGALGAGLSHPPPAGELSLRAGAVKVVTVEAGSQKFKLYGEPCAARDRALQVLQSGSRWSLQIRLLMS